MYCGKFDPKREVCTLKGTKTLTDYKSLFIYTHLYLQALIQVSSFTIQWNPGSFHWILVLFDRNPVESSRMDAFLQESVGHQKVQPHIQTGYDVLLEWDHVYTTFTPTGSRILSGDTLGARV